MPIHHVTSVHNQLVQATSVGTDALPPGERRDNAALGRSVRALLTLLRSEADALVRARLLCALLLVLGSAVLTSVAPITLKYLVDGLSSNESRATYVASVLLILCYVGAHWLARSLTELRGLAYNSAERRLHRRLSQRLFAHVMDLPMRFHVDRKTGAIGQTLVQGLQGFQLFLQHLTFTLVSVAVELVTAGIVLIQLGHPVYALILSLAVVGYGVTFALGVAYMSRSARVVSATHIGASAVMTDVILNYETVKYFAAESEVQRRYDRALCHAEFSWTKFYRQKTLTGIAVASIFATSLGAAMCYAGRQVWEGTMTVGDLVLVTTYLIQLVRPIEALGFAVQDLSRGLAFVDKMLELLRQTPEPAQPTSAASPSGCGELQFENVTFAYRPDHVVLRDVSFTVGPGKTIGIVGASGAGKSSLIRLLVRLYEPDSGRILLDGVPITQLSLTSLRRAVAVVPQDTVLFDDTIAYNIGFGNSGATQQEIEQAAKVAQLHNYVLNLPEGYETVVGERGVKLSGGEKQRISIARAVLRNPRVFLFDEATSSLDTRTERHILRNLRDVAQGRTTLVIAHRLSTVTCADEIVLLDGGTVVERGTHVSLLRRQDRYAALWEAQHGISGDGSHRAAFLG